MPTAKLALVLIVLSLGFLDTESHATQPCLLRGWNPFVITPSDQPIPKDGHVLVGVEGNGSPSAKQDPTIRQWQLRRGRKSIDFDIEVLAPGLARYTPKRRPSGKWTVSGAGVGHPVRFSSASAGPPGCTVAARRL